MAGLVDVLRADVAAKLDLVQEAAVTEFGRSTPLRAVGGGGALRGALVVARPTPLVLVLSVDDRVAPHGKWIDDPPQEIRPKRAKMLSWVDPITLERVYAKKVTPSRRHAGWWSVRYRAFVNAAVLEVFSRGLGRVRRG
jgi:hypothetical protein